MQVYLNRVENAADALSNVGLEMKEELVMLILLGGLASEYAQLRTTLEALPSLSPDECKGKLLHEELRRHKTDADEEQAIDLVGAAIDHGADVAT